jgi:hypothetical protein
LGNRLAEADRQGVKATKPTTEAVTFLASMPDVLSQLRIGKDGMRLQLEIPESEMAAALKLVLYRDRVLRVTVEPED